MKPSSVYVERSSATFFGRFQLPNDAALRQVRASMNDGGSQLTVPCPGSAPSSP